MNLFSKFKKQSSSHPCLVCNKKIGKDYSEVRYKYQGGTGTAYVCKICSEEMDQSNIDKETEDGFSV
jgi:hypothetical protein